MHCVKSVRIWRYSGLYFPVFGLNSISPYSVRMLKNTDQNNSECGGFLRRDGKMMRSHIYSLFQHYYWSSFDFPASFKHSGKCPSFYKHCFPIKTVILNNI